MTQRKWKSHLSFKGGPGPLLNVHLPHCAPQAAGKQQAGPSNTMTDTLMCHFPAQGFQQPCTPHSEPSAIVHVRTPDLHVPCACSPFQNSHASHLDGKPHLPWPLGWSLGFAWASETIAGKLQQGQEGLTHSTLACCLCFCQQRDLPRAVCQSPQEQVQQSCWPSPAWSRPHTSPNSALCRCMTNCLPVIDTL